MSEQDFDVNSFREGTTTSDALQPGGCLAVSCLLSATIPGLSIFLEEGDEGGGEFQGEEI